MEGENLVVYKAGPIVSQFISDDTFVRALMGPVGSGKSVACVMEIVRRSRLQRAFKGVRKTRWAIVRNTYRELLDTTVQTWFDWVPKSLGKWSTLNSKFTLVAMLSDDTVMHMEVLFRALDKPSDVKKLLSLELTGMWINEAREIPKAILDMGISRVGRYPSKRDGGPSWHGMIMDTNPPDSDHWWYKLFEEERPENFMLYKQPGGLDKGAENVENLPTNYYTNIQSGKKKEWVEVYVHGKYGFVSDGQPIYPEYNDTIHHPTTHYRHINNSSTTIYVGIDFGLTPAAVIAYFSPFGQLVVYDELVTFNMGAVNFGQILHRVLSTAPFDKCSIEVYGDPAGEQRSQTDEMTPFLILANQGIIAYPVFTNDVTIRRESVARLLTQLDASGNPMLVVGEKASMVRKGFMGGYRYRRMQVVGSERYADKPDKNQYSHVHDALQYLVLGAIGQDNIIGGSKESNLDYSNTIRAVR